MKREAQTIAVELLRRHPGWSDPRVRKELEKRGIVVADASIQRWRVDAGLAPHTHDVEQWPPPRVAGVWLTCGHLVHPETVNERARGRCNYCGAESELAGG